MPKKVKAGIAAKKNVTYLDSSLRTEDSNISSSSDESESVSPAISSSCKGSVLIDTATPALTLSCLRNWSSEKMEHCFQNYVSKVRKKEKIPKVGAPKLSKIEDFTPWWDSLILPRKSAAEKEVNLMKDADSFNNWFNKSCPQSVSWLSGSRPCSISEKKIVQQSAPVEDIEVPSIYSQRPKTKGRRALKRERKAEREKTLGKKWFEMRAPEVDDSTRMDMEMIRMRGVLDPKRFYKHNDRGALPKYFQMGTVVDEGTDFYSSRLTKKQRKQTLVEELMADANIRQYNKRKYSEVQQKMRNKKFKGKNSAAS